MKRLFCFAILTSLSVAAQAADTAYTAIRVVSKKNGEEALSRVVEVRGRFGAPEPQVWKVVLAERGGVHEFEVQKGRITGDRTPSGRAGGAALDLNKLNIDSDGAFTIVNQEAQKVNKPFDRVDYSLSNSGRNGAPVWHLDIYDGRNGKVASMDIGADTGTILNRDFQGGRDRPVAQDDREFLREQSGRERRPPVADDRRPYDDRRYDYPDDRRRIGDDDGRRLYRDGDEEPGPGITDIFGKIGRHFEKRGKQFKSFFGH